MSNKTIERDVISSKDNEKEVSHVLGNKYGLGTIFSNKGIFASNPKVLTLITGNGFDIVNDEIVYTMPPYQRSSEWTFRSGHKCEKTECGRFVEDALAAMEDKASIDLGTHIYRHRYGNIFEVVDGQQKSRNHQILLRVCIDIAYSINSNLVQDLEYVKRKFLGTKENPKLVLSSSHDKFFNYLVYGRKVGEKIDESGNHYKYEKSVLSNYKQYKKRIEAELKKRFGEENNKSDKIDFLIGLMDVLNHSLKVSVKITGCKEEAQRLYHMQNTVGSEMSISGLSRFYLATAQSNEEGAIKVRERIDNVEDSLVNDSDEIDKFYLKMYKAVRGVHVKEDDWQDYIAKESENDETSNKFISEMETCAEIYNSAKYPTKMGGDGNFFKINFGEEVYSLVLMIQAIDSEQCIAPMMTLGYLYKNGSPYVTGEYVKNFLFKCSSYLLRNMAKVGNRNDYQKNFTDLCKGLLINTKESFNNMLLKLDGFINSVSDDVILSSFKDGCKRDFSKKIMVLYTLANENPMGVYGFTEDCGIHRYGSNFTLDRIYASDDKIWDTFSATTKERFEDSIFNNVIRKGDDTTLFINKGKTKVKPNMTEEELMDRVMTIANWMVKTFHSV